MKMHTTMFVGLIFHKAFTMGDTYIQICKICGIIKCMKTASLAPSFSSALESSSLSMYSALVYFFEEEEMADGLEAAFEPPFEAVLFEGLWNTCSI